MSPCNPSEVSINVPEGPSGPPIKGFGVPFSLDLKNLNPFPDGFPEDLLELMNKLQLLIPPGTLKPQLNPNYGKDVFDAIMKLLDQFVPFLMLYKFFLPILELIICIIEVLCALMNPFKLIRALNRLFSRCIPAFLNIFPIFALIIMIISLLLLILALIEYILSQILKIIKTILRNINALTKAFEDNDDAGVLAIAKKIGSLLCIFQNLFVLFEIFNIIIQVIKDILSVVFAIPPCEDGDPSDQDLCCTPDVCPAIVKQDYTRFTGNFKYLPQASVKTNLTLPAIFGGSFNFDVRSESWQFFDLQQEQAQQFRNIFDAYDVTITPKPIFFPTDVTYNAGSDLRQVPYTVDMRMYYNPISWGRTGNPRYIRFNNCILSKVPNTNLTNGDLSTSQIYSAIAILVGGTGTEDDGTPLTGFAADGKTPISSPATIENFFHMPGIVSSDLNLSNSDGYEFHNVEYTFRPNIAPLLQKNLVTLGCVPSIALNRAFINNVYAGDIALKTQLLGNLVKDSNFPNPAACQECLLTAIATLRSDMTVSGVANFQATAELCLKKLKDDTNSALSQLVGIGFDPCKSKIDLNPIQQFTTLPIVITVDLNERNGLSLTSGLSKEIAENIAARIKGYPTFGDISNFTYDGYQSFNANLTSENPGSGTVMVSFDNQTFCTNIFPENVEDPPLHTLQAIDYKFIYTPAAGGGVGATGEGDTDGQPRRDAGDQSRDSSNGNK